MSFTRTQSNLRCSYMAFSFDDKIIFPTRTGDSIGSANERTMLTSVQGPEGIRTKILYMPDGSRAMLRTRGGSPEFTRENRDIELDDTEAKFPYGFVDTTYDPIGVDGSGTLKYLIDEAGQVESAKKTIIPDSQSWKAELFANLPTNYSGMMRRVMQVKHAARNGSVDDFSCTYTLSHGLVITETGKRWIIEISSSGIYRIPITFRKELTTSWIADENAVFLSNTYEDAVALLSPYWDVKRFKTTDKVMIAAAPASYALGYAPWYAWCGWAFSYTGLSATIVCLGATSSGSIPTQTSMFDISIAMSGDTPDSASCTNTSPVPIATNTPDGTADGEGIFQTPAASVPGFCSTTSMYVPGAPSLTALIFSFYTPGGKEVYSYTNYSASTAIAVDDNRSSTTITIPIVGAWDPLGGLGTFGNTNANVVSPATGVLTSNTTTSYYSSHGFSGTGTIPTMRNKSEYASICERVNGGSSGWYVNSGVPPYAWKYSPAVGSPYYVYDVNGLLTVGVCFFVENTAEETYTKNTTVSAKQTVIMSGYDREAIAFASAETTSIPEYSVTSVYSDVCIFSGTIIVRDSGWFVDYKMGSALYTLTDPREISGLYDWGGAVGQGISMAAGLRSGAGLEFSIDVFPADTSRTEPSATSSWASLLVFVGGNAYSVPLGNDDLFKAYVDGDQFMFRYGSAVWRPERVFYSANANIKPTTAGFSYGMAQRSLNNFIGIF